MSEMKFTHKIGAIRFFENGCSMSNVYTFTSNCNDYKSAALSIVNHTKELHDCFIYEPETASPITFDLTVDCKPHDHVVRSDRYFLTFNELKKFCDDDSNYVTVITQPFCRIIFSKAGDLGNFLEFHGKVKKHFIEFKGSLYNNPKKFEAWDVAIFNSIKNGSFYTNYINGFVFNNIGDLVRSPEIYTKDLLIETYNKLISDREYIRASRINHLINIY